MSLPTIESITNRYLYKQDELVDNRLDERIIDEERTKPISVDKSEFMKGPGRFIKRIKIPTKTTVLFKLN